MDSNLFVIIISYRLTYKATEGKQILLRNTATNATFIGQKLIERLNVISICVNQISMIETNSANEIQYNISFDQM